MIVVDTPVWSLALRRKPEQLAKTEGRIVQVLSRLIDDGRAGLLGAVRQELLSGLREETQFRRLRDLLRDFPDLSVSSLDYEEAAHSSNRCRGAGIAASPVDMLICALALRHDCEIFTTDKDFVEYQRILKIQLLAI